MGPWLLCHRCFGGLGSLPSPTASSQHGDGSTASMELHSHACMITLQIDQHPIHHDWLPMVLVLKLAGVGTLPAGPTQLAKLQDFYINSSILLLRYPSVAFLLFGLLSFLAHIVTPTGARHPSERLIPTPTEIVLLSLFAWYLHTPRGFKTFSVWFGSHPLEAMVYPRPSRLIIPCLL